MSANDTMFLSILSIVLIILTPLPYILQSTRVYTLRSAHGISLRGTALNALVCQIQVAYMYYMFLMSPTMDEGVPVATPSSLRDRLNAAQLIVQWLSSLILYGLVLHMKVTAIDERATDSVSPRARGTSMISGAASVVMLLVHTGLFYLSWTLRNTRPDDYLGGPSITWNIAAFIFNPLATFLLAVGLLLQLIISWPSQASDAMSGTALIAQCIVFSVLAILWPFRLILPQNLWAVRPVEPVVITIWYPVVGSVCVNNGMLAVGAGILWWTLVRKGPDGQDVGTEGER